MKWGSGLEIQRRHKSILLFKVLQIVFKTLEPATTLFARHIG